MTACSFTVRFLAMLTLSVLLAGCDRKDQHGTKPDPKPSADAFLGIDEDTTPEERKYLLAAKPFFVALAGRKYGDVYAMLSSHAKARMSLNQFVPDEDEAAFAKNEKEPLADVTAEQFADMMKRVEDRHGLPRAPKMLSVFSTDPDVLNRRSKEQFGAMDSMFAIGAMPDSVPADIRRASLRGQISTQLSADEIARIAKDQGTTVEELRKDPDFDPYFNIKLVLVEEDGQLRVAYFEILPPSMLD